MAAESYKKSPMKVISRDGHVYYLIHGDNDPGWTKVQQVKYYSTLFQIPLADRADNPLFFVEQASVNPGGDNYGDPRVKNGWGLYLWMKEDQKYYLIAKEDSTDYVSRGDLENYVLKNIYTDFVNRINKHVNDIDKLDTTQSADIELLKKRISSLGNSLHSHSNLDTLEAISEVNGELFYNGSYIGGNSYVYDVRNERGVIYWKNPIDPTDVDLCINTSKGIAQKFAESGLARKALTLFVVESDNSLSVFKLGIKTRTKIDKIVDKYDFCGGAEFDETLSYMLRDTSGNYVAKTKAELLAEGILKPITEHEYIDIEAVAGNEVPDSLFTEHPDMSVVYDDTDIIANLQKLSEAGLVEVPENSSTLVWTSKAEGNMTYRSSTTVMLLMPTIGLSPDEDIIRFGGESFPAGEGIYSHEVVTIQVDQFEFEPIFDQRITTSTYGIESIVDTLPRPEETMSNGIWLPLQVDQYGRPANHKYKCVFVGKTAEYLGSTVTVHEPEEGWDYLYQAKRAYDSLSQLEELYTKRFFLLVDKSDRIDAEVELPEGVSVWEFERGINEYELILVDNKSAQWILDWCELNEEYAQYYYSPYELALGQKEIVRLQDTYVWKDITAALTEDFECPGAEMLLGVTDDETMWQTHHIAWKSPEDVSVDKNGIYHKWAKDIVVMKHGSVPKNVGDGVQVCVSTKHNEYSDKSFTVNSSYQHGTEVYFAVFSFDVSGAQYISHDVLDDNGTVVKRDIHTIQPQLLTWDSVQDILASGLGNLLWKSGDVIVLPNHVEYGEIETVVLDVETIDSKQYLKLAAKHAICRKIFDPQGWTYYMTTDTTVKAAALYFVKKYDGSTFLGFSQVQPAPGSNPSVNGYFERVPAGTPAPLGRNEYFEGYALGSNVYSESALCAWLNGRDGYWAQDVPQNVTMGDIPYAEEDGFLAGFSENDMFSEVDGVTVGLLTSDDIDKYRSVIGMEKHVGRGKVDAWWWSATATGDYLACYNGSSPAMTGVPSEGVGVPAEVPGVVPVFHIGPKVG